MASLLEVLQGAKTFTTLLQGVEQAGLTDALQSGEQLTLFAPTDAAFAKLDKKVLEKLFADKTRLTKVLRYHLVAGDFSASELEGIATLTTLEGDDLQIDGDNGVRVDEATVITPDLMADNGVLHGVDQVILPEKYLY